MIYDPNKIPNVQVVNGIVMDIRANQMKKLAAPQSKDSIQKLITLLSIETCEQFLNQVFNLPWIPLKEFNGLSLRQLAEYTGCSTNTARRYHVSCERDSKRVTYDELRSLSEQGAQHSWYRRCRASVTFKNGTVLNSPPSNFFALNPRAVAYVVVGLSEYNKTCSMLLMRFYDSICNDEEWILPIPTTAPSEPLTDAYEAAPQPVIVAETSSEPAVKPAPVALPEPLESAVIKFLNSLKPGTKIQIVIPA